MWAFLEFTTPLKKYLIGKRYQGEKKAESGRSGRRFGVDNITTPNKNEVVKLTTLKTAEKIADQVKVSEKNENGKNADNEQVVKSTTCLNR